MKKRIIRVYPRPSAAAFFFILGVLGALGGSITWFAGVFKTVGWA
jgi:hypothetical protein